VRRSTASAYFSSVRCGDLRGELRPGGLLVPRSGRGQRLQVLPQELLVEALLGAARVVGVGGPEAGAVGGQRLVDEHWLGVLGLAPFVELEPELELGVGDDDPALGCILRRRVVDLEGSVAEERHGAFTDEARGLGEGDVLVVGADLLLGRRGEDRRGEAFALGESAGKRHAADRAGRLIVLPPRALDVPPDDALDGDDAAPAADHHATGQIVPRGPAGEGRIGDQGRVVGDQVRAADAPALDEPEPVRADPGEELALAGDGGGHDDVEGGDAVRGHQEHPAPRNRRSGRELIDVPDLPPAEPGKAEVSLVNRPAEIR
jgi:hypothetical protein